MAEEFKRNQIIFSIQQYLNNLLVNPPSNVDVESLDVVLQCLKSSFSVDITEQEHQKLYSINKTLTQVFEDGYFASPAQNANNEPKDEIFEANFKHYLEVLTEKGYFKNVPLGSDEYEARVQKAREKLIENEKVKGAENEKKAEEKKAEGNNYVASRQFEEAIASYTAAINLSPKNPIYYANRAAAYSHLKEHEKAIEDCKLAIAVDPKYSKAYSRMGLAHFSLGQYEEAFNAYTKAFELDPSDTIKQSLQIAEKKIKEKMDSNSKIAPKEGNAGAGAAGAGAAGNPLAGLDFSSLLSNPAVQNIIGNLGKNNNNNDNSNSGEQPQAPPGGLPNLGDISEMLNNPSVRSAAENVMSNPNFANLLNNPAIMNMASSFLQNPDMLNSVFQNFGLNNNNNNNQ